MIRSGTYVLRALLMVALFAAGAAEAAAQGNGRIVGRVVDSESGNGLTNVRIEVEGAGVGTLSGVGGRFMLHEVPEGTVTLRVETIGYGVKNVTDVVVRDGAATEQNITLDPAAVALAAIEVSASAERGSVNRALDMQRNASGIMNAISSEQIARSPDGDAAAAVQRVSGATVQEGKFVFVRGLGERYTTTSLNGTRIPSPEPERKMVPLDLFPSGLLQQITTAKTFTPNLPGDFSGAQVDIQTREYPGTRQMTVSVSQGVNSVTTGRTLPMAPSAGGEWRADATAPRSLPTVVQETQAPSPGHQTNQMVNALRNTWSVNNRTGTPSTSLGLSLGGTDAFLGRDVGYLVSGTYSTSDEANIDARRENVEGDIFEGEIGRRSVLLGGLLNVSTMLGTHSRVLLNNTYNRSADNEARFETGFYENHGTNIQIERLRYIERSVRAHQLQLQHQFGRSHRLDWSLSTSAVSRQEPDRSEFVTWLDPETPIWYNQEGAFRAFGGLTEDALEASANYRVDLGSGSSRSLRFGGLYRTAERSAYDNGYSIYSREWAPTDSRWQLKGEQIFDGRYSQNGEEIFGLGIYNAGGNYGADERIAAAYAMVEWSIAPWLQFVGGARIENSETEVRYQDVLGNEGVTDPSYTDVLPSLALNIDLTGSQKLRLSATQTLARPEYREMAPICYRAGLGDEQRCGNPDLERTLIQNYDVRWEMYPSAGEMLSLGVFAKRFDKPIEPRYQGRSGTNSLWFENAVSAMNYGVEVEARRSLGFLWQPLETLHALANATAMKSEIDTGNPEDGARAMTGQSPYVVNAGLTWSSPVNGASATLLFNVVGERIINARPSGQTVPDMVEAPRPGLDLSLRFPELLGVAAKLDFRNLLDSPYEVTQGELQRVYYRTGRSMSLGLSWRQ
ncbi:MAG: TonB-dependent receptor [Gemmatimonadetes bacterium]|nr:TonB-dependent receptor [Gemmatimonadota bacterium]